MAGDRCCSPDFRNRLEACSSLTPRNVSLPSIMCHEGGKYMNPQGGSKRSHTDKSSTRPLNFKGRPEEILLRRIVKK